MIDSWKGLLDDKNYVISIFLDLSKAFDTIDHELLLTKLSFYNFSAQSILLVKNYLFNRFCITNFDGAKSKKEALKVGVPQGSVLGPLLFIIFINDFCHLDLKSDFFLFADDSTVSFAAKTIKEVLDSLSNDLKIICEWLKHNRLIINWSKTHAILFNYATTKSSSFINFKDINLSFDGLMIPFVEQTKILGVIIDDRLKFNLHIIAIFKKINSKVHLLSRNLYLFTSNFRTSLFKIFIQSHFDYCSSLFIHLPSKADQARLESVFSKSIKKIINLNIKNLNPSIQYKLLYNFNILPLIFRSFQHYCTFIHSTFKFNSNSILALSILIYNARNKLIQPNFNFNQKKYSFSVTSSKLLSVFILSKLSISKLAFRTYILNNIIKLYNTCNHIWDIDITY